MVKKLFIVTACISLALSACSGGGATQPPAATWTEPADATALVSITEAPATTEAATTAPPPTVVTDTPGTPASPTVDPSIPTNPADCTNSALFVTDVTIPDNTNMVGGTKFTKTWRISNNGTCVWGPTYTLNHYSDESLGLLSSVPLGLTYPGQTLDISVDLTAPNTTGTHRGNFVIENPQGLIMKIADDSRLWIIINVTSVSAATIAVSATPIGATNTPEGTAMPTPTGPTPTQGASGPGATTATCNFTTDRTKLTEVINAVNAYRAQKGLPAYTVNTQLAQAAQRHANDIACHKLYVHTGTDGSTA
ncbi:MAG TPA: NBR1-Ig-like domain-containing protein, partial [Anaerolineales bacterium]|nr:NBR1-Ig-like domain-containing protein [Anaerolineales bacterium]